MTAQGRTTASRLTIGDRILVELYDGEPRSTTRKLTGKNGVVVATVEGLNNAAPVDQYGYGRRVTYRRIHTDLGSFDAAPSQTFALAPAPEAFGTVPAGYSVVTQDEADALLVAEEEPLGDLEREVYKIARWNGASHEEARREVEAAQAAEAAKQELPDFAQRQLDHQAADQAQLDEDGEASAVDVVEAAVDVVEVIVNGLGFGLAGHFTCSEAEIVAQLIRTVRGEADAQSFLADHAEEDDEGDEHYALRSS